MVKKATPKQLVKEPPAASDTVEVEVLDQDEVEAPEEELRNPADGQEEGYPGEADNWSGGEDADEEAQPLDLAPATPPAPVDTLQRYLWEIRQYQVLSRDEQEELAKRYHDTGDTEAAAKLATSNLRLVVKIAMEHQRYWMSNLLDLIQEGNAGLLQAVKKFDPFRGIKFSYYASFWIKAYILKFIMDNWRLVRLGTTQAQRKLFYNLSKEKEKLQAMGITPGPRLLAERMGVSEQDVIDMDQRLDSWELSLDAPVRDDSNDPHQSFLPDEQPSAEESLVEGELRQLFHEGLMQFRETLDDKERDILDHRILSEEPLTLNELGDRHGVSRERVRQIQVRLLDKLKAYMQESIPNFEGLFADLAEGE
ncbi:RNA polymerase sigma70 [Desulfocarbo indianensis]|nr:RNA polymerase sigma70 [Desulfocarbo indianensis]